VLTALIIGILGANPTARAPIERPAPPARPGRHMVEVGLGLGTFIPSANHELYDSTSAPQSTFDRLGADIVLRASYFPLSFVGVEGELGLAPIGDAADDTDLLYTARGHLMLQYPARFSPFVLGGGGMLGVDSPRGGDLDRAAHWGAGIKYYAKPWLSFRVDGRHIVSAARGPGAGNTDHFEALIGVSVTLFRAPERPRPAPIAAPLPELTPAPEPPPEPEGEPASGVAEIDPAEVIREAMNDVQFGFDSAEVQASQHALLDQIYDAMMQAPSIAIVITGHTCSLGTATYNQGLSVRRAEAVRDYLLARGLEPARVRVQGDGERDPQYSNDEEADRTKNRRTDFEVLVISAGPLVGSN